jgi:hypothetical protein
MRSVALLTSGICIGMAACAAAATPAEGPACTLIGCESGVRVNLTPQSGGRAFPRAGSVTVCMDATCKRFSARGDSVRLTVPSQSGAGPVRVRVVLRNRRGRVLRRFDREVVLTRSQPNGPECEPTCWSVAYEIRDRLRLTRVNP